MSPPTQLCSLMGPEASVFLTGLEVGVTGCTISNSAHGGSQKAGSPCCDSGPAHIPRKPCPGHARGRWFWMQFVDPEQSGKGSLKDSWPREGPHRTAGGGWVRLGAPPGQAPLRILACWPAEPAHCFVCKSPPLLSLVPTPTSVPI